MFEKFQQGVTYVNDTLFKAARDEASGLIPEKASTAAKWSIGFGFALAVPAAAFFSAYTLSPQAMQLAKSASENLSSDVVKAFLMSPNKMFAGAAILATSCLAAYAAYVNFNKAQIQTEIAEKYFTEKGGVKNYFTPSETSEYYVLGSAKAKGTSFEKLSEVLQFAGTFTVAAMGCVAMHKCAAAALGAGSVKNAIITSTLTFAMKIAHEQIFGAPAPVKAI